MDVGSLCSTEKKVLHNRFLTRFFQKIWPKISEKNTYKILTKSTRVFSWFFFLRRTIRKNEILKAVLRAKKKILTKYLQKVPVA